VRLVEDGRGREEAEEKDETRRNTLTEGGKTQQHCSTWIPYSLPPSLLFYFIEGKRPQDSSPLFIIFVLEK
jgi:hypothetical protein